MALKLVTEINNTGVTGEYIRVISFNVHIPEDLLEIHIGIYATQAARDMGKQPISVKSYSFKVSEILGDAAAITTTENMLDVYNNLREYFYRKLKSSEFYGAEDV